MNRDDYLRAVRALFREIVKSLRYDMDFPAFCRGLMTERTEDKQFKEMEVQFKVCAMFHVIRLKIDDSAMFAYCSWIGNSLPSDLALGY